MTIRYCPICRRLVKAKVLKGGCSQKNFGNTIAKRRKIVHLSQDDGCNHIWYTLEIPEHVLTFLF